MNAALKITTTPLRDGGPPLARVSLGCGSFGGLGSNPEFFGAGMSDDEAAALMDAAWELGITHFDTADAYGGGRSEQAIGRWISSRGVRPALTTKTFNRMAAGADRGLAPDRIERQLEGSLERLGVDHVELYLAHDYDPDTPLDETIATFAQLRGTGAILAYGVSNFDAGQLERALVGGAPSAIQNNYSLLERADEADVLPLAAAEDAAYIAYSPLCGGWLTGKYRRDSAYPEGSRMTQFPGPYAALANDATFDALDELDALATERGISMAGAALAWLLADDRVTQIVAGPARPEHLGPVREALENPLTQSDHDRLSEAFK